MPEKLSQNQIDALLQKLTAGEVPDDTEDQHRVREYDFRSPKKFTKEQLKALDSLHENFSRVLSTYLSGLLRVFCEITVLQIEEERYYEYNNALPDTALLGMVDLKPSEKRYNDSSMILNMSTTLGYFMIDRLLGGSGNGCELTRDYTDIEIAILTNAFAKITAHLQTAWCNYIDMKVELHNIETNSRLMQALAPEDTVVIVLLNMKIRDLVGSLSICIPASFLEETIDHFSLKYARTSKRIDPDEDRIKQDIIFGELTESSLEIKAILDEFQLDIRDVLHLQVDDVIPLTKKIQSDITITVDNMPWFTGKMGETKQKKAIKLGDLIA